MQQSSKPLAILIFVAALLLSADSRSQERSPQAVREARINSAVRRLDDAAFLAKKGEYVQAESLAKISIDDIDAAGGNPRIAHVMLGRILLREGRIEDSLPELGWGWKPSKNERQDLLYAVAGSQSTDSYHRTLAKSALMIYLRVRQKLVLDRLGDPEVLPKEYDPVHVIAVASLLYAADATIPTDDAMEFLAQAEQILPKHPAVAYIRGLTYLRMSKNADAKRELQFAAAHAKGKLGEMANAQLGRLGTIQG